MMRALPQSAASRKKDLKQLSRQEKNERPPYVCMSDF
jgi:hypothetical protein